MNKRPVLRYLLAMVAAYFALWWLVPKATFLPHVITLLSTLAATADKSTSICVGVLAALIMSAPTVAFMAIQIGIVYYIARLRMSGWQTLGALVGCIAGVIALLTLIIWQSGVVAKMGRYPNVAEHFWVLGHYFGPLKTPISVLFMFAAAFIGYLVSLRIRDRNLLLPVVMLAAYIDFWTVTRGPVAAVLKKSPHVAEAVSAPIPQAGAGSFVPATFMGPGDFLFMALVFAVVHRLDMDSRRNYWFVFAAMTLGMLAVMVGVVSSLPALMVLAVAVVAANWRKFKLSRQEMISTAIVAALLIISLPIVWSVLRPATQKAPAPKASAPASAPDKSSR